MPGDVFISYAREDKAFVRRLHTGLAERGRDAWVDWEDIPLTADWWAEIQRGIDAANAFVFIISPDSARSAVCFREIDYASQHNKRLVPIVWREITDLADEQRLHPAINAHNWIFIRDTDDFDGAFNALVEALDTDLYYVREHTTLLIRARAWEGRQRDSALLLRGDVLKDAEQWLADGKTKERNRPTELHEEYITRSRRAQNRRTQRTWVISAVVTVIVALAITSLVLFVQAEQQRQRADEQRALAEDARRDAEASEAVAQAVGVSAQAQLELFGLFPERGVLLALEALQNYPYVFQGERALGTAVQNSRVRAIYAASPAATNAVMWSPDGARFITVGDANTAQVWDAATYAPLHTLIGHTREIMGVDWSRDGTHIATGSWDQTARIWDAQSGALIRTLAGHTDWVLDVAWSPDGARLATASADGYVRVWDARTGNLLLRMFAADFTFVNSVMWSRDGLWLLTAEQDGIVRIWDAQSGAQLVSWTAHADNIAEAAWSPDGTRVATAGWDETVRMWDVSAALDVTQAAYVQQVQQPVAPLYTITSHVNAVTSVAWSPDGVYILTTSRDRTSQVWSAATGAGIYTLSGHTAEVNDGEWSPDGAYILTVGEDQRARLWIAAPNDDLLTLTGHTLRVNDVAWSGDSQMLATVSADRSVRVWNADAGGQIAGLEGHTRAVNSATWSPDSTLVVTASDDRTVRIWDVATGETVYTFKRHKGAANGAAWSPDGTRIASVCDDGCVLLWSSAHGGDLLTLIAHKGGINDIAWSPDGTRIISASDDSTAMIWDARSGRRLAEIDTGESKVLAAAFSPVSGDDRAIVVPEDGTAQVWALDPAADGTLTPRLLLTLSGHTLPLTDAAWSPNGQRIITVSKDRTALVWDAASGAQLLSLTGHGDDVLGVDWSPDGAQIATASADMTARTWRAFQATDALIAYAEACCAVRDLSAAERAQFNLPPAE